MTEPLVSTATEAAHGSFGDTQHSHSPEKHHHVGRSWLPASLAANFLIIAVVYVIATGVAVVIAFEIDHRHPNLSAHYHALTIGGIGDAVATLIVFLFSFLCNNTSVYDIYWSVAPPALVIYWLVQTRPDEQTESTVRRAFITISVFVWAIRLTLNWARGWTGLSHEDWRYVDMRTSTGKGYWLVSLLALHFIPTAQVFLCCVPLYFGLAHGGTANAADYVGFITSLLAVLLEATADEQLRKFVATAPRGTNCETGLWKYSRHPNYCGEMLFWWSCYFYALGAAADKYWWMFVGPLSVMITVIAASIPLMEKRQLARRPGYAEYQAKTSMLVPLPKCR